MRNERRAEEENFAFKFSRTLDEHNALNVRNAIAFSSRVSTRYFIIILGKLY